MTMQMIVIKLITSHVPLWYKIINMFISTRVPNDPIIDIIIMLLIRPSSPRAQHPNSDAVPEISLELG